MLSNILKRISLAPMFIPRFESDLTTTYENTTIKAGYKYSVTKKSCFGCCTKTYRDITCVGYKNNKGIVRLGFWLPCFFNLFYYLYDIDNNSIWVYPY